MSNDSRRYNLEGQTLTAEMLIEQLRKLKADMEKSDIASTRPVYYIPRWTLTHPQTKAWAEARLADGSGVLIADITDLADLEGTDE